MKTEYKILWIDDEHRYVRGDKRVIADFLEDQGIQLLVRQIDVTQDDCPTSSAEFETAVADVELDMVLIDFNMPEMGDKIIRHIRNNLHHYHLPILFYTGDDNARRTLQGSISALNDTEISNLNIADGIYFCDRDHIAEKAKNILTSLLKKESRPQQGRGILMDRVSEIDAQMIQFINDLWLKVPEKKRAVVAKEMNERLASKCSNANSLKEDVLELNYEEIGEFLQVKDNSLRMDTFTRTKILREILRALPEFEQEGKILSTFCHGETNLNALRNNYAHKTTNEIEPEHNEVRCKYIRTETRKHLANLNDLRSK